MNQEPTETSAAGLLDQAPPPEVFRTHLEIRRRLSVLLLCLLSVVLLWISFAPFDCWFVAYIALVPWALAVGGGTHRKWAIFSGWISGWVFWLGSVYWLALPTVAGYIAGTLYLSLYGLAAAMLVRSAMRRSWPIWIMLPVLAVGLEFLRARTPVLGFPWFFLAQTQYAQTRLIQICDVTGQYGVSFFVAMVNGVVIDLLSSPLFVLVGRRVRLAAHIFTGLGVSAVVAAGLLLYGTWRLGQFHQATAPGPKVGIVQEAFPLTLDPTARATTLEMLEAHLRQSMNLIGGGCDVVFWPETMLPNGMNRQIVEADLGTLDDDSIRSLAGQMFGADFPREHNPVYVRTSVLNIVGQHSRRDYRAAAVRAVLERCIEVTQLQNASDDAVRELGRRLFGPQADKAVIGELKLAMEFYVPGEAFLVQDSPVNFRAAGRLILGPQRAIPEETQEVIQAARAEARRQQAQDETDLLRLRMRCQSAMVETCSLLLGCPILAGGSTYHRNLRPTGPDDLWVMSNGVVAYDAEGPRDVEYAKCMLVPFSEYVPGKYAWPGMHALLRGFVPEAMPQLEPGRDVTRFEIRRDGHTWQVAAPICFEGTIARLCRRMVNAGPKDNLVLANLSNDGWFVYRRGPGPYRATTEHAQHLAHSVFRAVENRVPVVRAVNTGISAIIDSSGRIQSVLEWTLEDYRKRTMISGVLQGKVLVDNRRTLYSFGGDVFALAVSAAAGVLAAMLIVRRPRTTKETQKKCSRPVADKL